jgi:hypothetical protein
MASQSTAREPCSGACEHCPRTPETRRNPCYAVAQTRSHQVVGWVSHRPCLGVSSGPRNRISLTGLVAADSLCGGLSW